MALDKSAMERAQREADGPRRRILEAARLKTVARVPEAAPQPVAVAVNVPLPAASASVQRAAQRSDVVEAEGVMSALSPAAPPLSLQSAAVAMSGIASVEPVVLAASTPALMNLPSPAQMAGLPPPRLLSRVDPELPAYLFRRGARRTELMVELVVNTDGSVSDVALRETPDPAFAAPVLDAVRQWRYEPQPAARPQTVRLVVLPG